MENSEVKDKKTRALNNLCYIFLVFLTGCIVGWIYEEIFYYFTEGLLQNRGILYGPWLPIYGVGALGIYAMKPIKKHPFLLFFLCVVITGILEYIIGYIGIHCFGLRLWDYRGLFLNISGIVCFRSVMTFGILGMAFHYLIEPAAKKLYSRMPERLIYAICIVIAVLFVSDCILSFLFRTPITY